MNNVLKLIIYFSSYFSDTLKQKCSLIKSI